MLDIRDIYIFEKCPASYYYYKNKAKRINLRNLFDFLDSVKLTRIVDKIIKRVYDKRMIIYEKLNYEAEYVVKRILQILGDKPEEYTVVKDNKFDIKYRTLNLKTKTTLYFTNNTRKIAIDIYMCDYYQRNYDYIQDFFDYKRTKLKLIASENKNTEVYLIAIFNNFKLFEKIRPTDNYISKIFTNCKKNIFIRNCDTYCNVCKYFFICNKIFYKTLLFKKSALLNNFLQASPQKRTEIILNLKQSFINSYSAYKKLLQIAAEKKIKMQGYQAVKNTALVYKFIDNKEILEYLNKNKKENINFYNLIQPKHPKLIRRFLKKHDIFKEVTTYILKQNIN